MTNDERADLLQEMVEAYDNVYDAEMSHGSSWTDNRPTAMKAALAVAEQTLGSARIAELERQRDDLQASNNAYLQRARSAEAILNSMKG